MAGSPPRGLLLTGATHGDLVRRRPHGATLEYEHLHKTKDAQWRQAWEKANIKGMVGQSLWLGYCIHEHQLVIVNRYDKNAADLLISSLLRGGYSGGPAVNHRGNVVGVMAENLYHQIEEKSPDRNATIGIAAATRVCYLKDILADKGEEWQPQTK